MVDCTETISSQSVQPAAAMFTISRPSEEQTFSVASFQFTVQLPRLNVFSSLILPVGASKKRAFDETSTAKAGVERWPREGVNTRQVHQSPQGFRSTKLRASLPSQRSDKRRLVVHLPCLWSKLRDQFEVQSSP